jgi:hypothetical protein
MNGQQAQAGDERSELGTAVPLEPHTYPPWIWLIGFGIFAMLVVSLIQLPSYYRAATLLGRAETLAEHGQDKNAVKLYTSVLEIIPSSKRARIELAISYFRSPDEDDHKRALEALQGLTFDKDEWQKLTAVMPVTYRQLFTHHVKN